MHNENGLSEQEKVPRCHMLAPHSAPPHLSWRSGAFNLPEKHSACACLWLAICLHRISFQFQSNSKHSHNMPQFTDVKKNTVTTLLSPSIASCSQKRMWSSKRCGLHTPMHRTEVDTSDWLASETHSKSSHSEINRVCSVSFASVQIRKDYFFFEYYLFDFNLSCFLMFFVFFINPINSNWSASQTWSWWSWLPSCRAPRHFGNARRDLTHSTEWICGAYGGPWSHGKVLGAFLGPTNWFQSAGHIWLKYNHLLKLIASFYNRIILTGGEVACCYLSHKSLHSEIPRIWKSSSFFIKVQDMEFPHAPFSQVVFRSTPVPKTQKSTSFPVSVSSPASMAALCCGASSPRAPGTRPRHGPLASNEHIMGWPWADHQLMRSRKSLKNIIFVQNSNTLMTS